MKRKIVIVGSGLAGSLLAYLLQDNCEIILLTKKKKKNSDSMLAQGGIACVLDKTNDSYNLHAQDTLVAGRFHNNLNAVKHLVEEGPDFLRELINDGLCFDQDLNGNFALGLEAAHSRRRILHAHGDQTGKVITSFIQSKLTQISLIENAFVVDLIKQGNYVLGVTYLDSENSRKEIFADKVILATGGLGQLFSFTSNDESITADGLALALRANVKICDSEFIQFHPTLLSIKGKCCGLISESVRGAGGRLKNNLDKYFMAELHPKADLAPRDVVSQAVYKENLQGNKTFLDISEISNFATRFPSISKNLQKHGIHFNKNKLIPIQAGAHFFMGGIDVDLSGRTNLINLYALGEVACTGVHGANRLASNSLLEILVFAHHVANDILNSSTMEKIFPKLEKPKNSINPQLPDLTILKKYAWESIGIIRKRKYMRRFLRWLDEFDTVDKIPLNWTKEEIAIYNLISVAKVITKSALVRKENLGAHYIADEKLKM